MARRFQDYVTGLLTGKFVTGKDPHGKVYKEFKPFKVNQYPTLANLRNALGSRVTEDELQIGEALRYRALDIDYSVFNKSDSDKAFLKRIKNAHRSTLAKAGFNPSKRLNISQPHIIRGK